MKGKIRVMVVEDQDATRAMIKQILVALGYEVCCSTDSGEKAVLMAEQFKPGIILMDHILKEGITGYDAAKIIKKNLDIPIILVTSMSATDFVKGTEEANLFGFINKPFKANSLKFTIENALYKFKVNRELEESENRFRMIFDNVDVGIVIIEKRTGVVKNINNLGVKIIGSPKGEILGKTWESSKIYSDDESLVPDLKDTKGRIEHETVIIRKGDANSVPVLMTRTPVSLRSENYFIESITDISELYRVKKKLRSLNDKYRQLFQDSKDIVFISSPEGRFIDINAAGAELFGYSSREEIMELEITNNLYSSPGMRQIMMDKLMKKGYVKDMQVEMKTKDGNKITTQITAHAYRSSDGKLKEIVGFIKDVTQKIEDEIMLLKMNSELLEANQKLKKTQVTLVQQEKMASIGQLAAGVAHELNNPLGFVQSNFEALEDYIAVFKDYIDLGAKLYDLENNVQNPEVKEIISSLKTLERDTDMGFIRDDLKAIFEESKEGVSRLVKIVNNLRSFSRIDESSKFEAFDLNSGIENSLVIANNSYKYVANVETELGDIPLVECNGGEVNQVVLNIIVNAAQAIESMERGEMGNISIKTSLLDEDTICCEIKDDGPGIPSEIVNKIFDPFFTTKEIGKGTGLGLNIAYNIVVNKHRGDLKVESDPEKGTRFKIILPVKSKYREDQDE